MPRTWWRVTSSGSGRAPRTSDRSPGGFCEGGSWEGTAVLAVTLAVAALVRGEEAERAVTAALEAMADHEGGEELEYLVEAAGGARPVDGPDQGFCLFTAGLAFQALVRG